VQPIPASFIPSASQGSSYLGTPGSNSISLSGLDPSVFNPSACSLGSPCTVYMAVLGAVANWGGGVYYQLTASTNSNIYNLTDGVPLRRTLVGAGASAAFAYSPPIPANVTFSFTLLTGSLNVSIVSDNGYSAIIPLTSTSAVQYITPGDYNPPPVPPYPVFYVSVTGASPTTSFLIEAFTSGGGFYVLPLQDGLPQAGIAQAHSMTYYNFTTSALGGFDIYATMGGQDSSGKSIYVSYGGLVPMPKCLNSDPASGRCTTWGADQDTYYFSSESDGLNGAGAYVTQVNGTLPSTSLIVAVLATAPDSSTAPAPPAVYTITAGSGSVLINLQGGLPFPGRVRGAGRAGGAKSYGFVPSISGDIVITADVTSGSLDLFASLYNVSAPPTASGNPAPYPGPPPAKSTWDSTSQGGTSFRGRSIRIPFASLPLTCQISIRYGLNDCGVAITVSGNPQLLAFASYFLTASQGGNPSAPTLLPEGNTVLLSIPASACTYVSALPEGGRFDFRDYIQVFSQLGSSTLYVNSQTQSFWQPGQGLIPDAQEPDIGGFCTWHSERGSSVPSVYYVTVCAASGSDVQAEITYRSARYVTPLESDVPFFGTSYCDDKTGECFPTLFSYTVWDGTAPVSFTTYRTTGSETLYISTSVAGQPWVLPGPNYYTWMYYPVPFSPSFTISTSDPNFCQPTISTPCTYLVAVVASEGQTAQFQITASSASSPLVTLYDGLPVEGTVIEYDPNVKNVDYYLYTPASTGFPAPPVSFSWSNYLGTVGLYVTNTFVPGSGSSAANLPGPAYAGTCQWQCTNFTACFALPGDPCYAANSPTGGAITYTVGVVGMSGNGPGQQNSYQLTAKNVGDPALLTHGLPTTNIVLFPYTNTTFVFDVESGGGSRNSAAYDLFVSASINHGDVTMMISPAFSSALGKPLPPPPACVPPASGSLTVCQGWVWQATGGIGDSLIYLSPNSAKGVCDSPITPPGTPPPLVDPTACATYFPSGALTRGRYYVTLYAYAQSELSLLVGDLTRPVPRTILADGQPLLLQTEPLTMCPGSTRDNVTEACPPGAPSNVTQGSISVFRIPAGTPMTYVNVLVERLCGGNVTGACGAELYIGINGCPTGNCSANILTPYMSDAFFQEVVGDAVGGYIIPFDACYPNGYNPPLAIAPDCIYAIGVWPRAPGGNGGNPPGVGVPPQTFRITLSTPIGTQRIPQDCAGSGRLCTLPSQAVAPLPALRFYESYASSNSQSGVAVALTAQLCYGSTLNLFACDVTAGSCSTPDRPAPRNADYSVSLTASSADALSTLTLPPWVAGGDIYFFSVGATGGTQPPFDVPTYELSIQHGTGILLTLGPGNTLAGSWDAAFTYFTITWTLPQLLNGPVAYPMENALFFVDTFLYGSTGTSMHLSSPCGVEYARRQNLTGSTGSFVRQADACVGTNCAFSLKGLANPNIPGSVSSWVTLTVSCLPTLSGKFSSGPCMPGNQEGQRATWTPILDNGAAPTPVPSPTPSTTPYATATATATLAPSPTPSVNNNGGKSSAAVAATVSVLLLVLFGGLGYATWKFGWADAYCKPAYTRLTQSFGSAESRQSSSKTREILSAHPIFGSSDSGGGGGSDYTALA